LVETATGKVRWDVVTCRDQRRMMHARVAMSPDGRFVVRVGSSEENWTLVDAPSGATWLIGAKHDGTGACVCGVARRKGDKVDEGCPLQAHTDGLCRVAFSPCGHFFATSAIGNDRAVIIWDAKTGTAQHVMQHDCPGHTRCVTSLAVSAGGGKVASGSFDGTILLWDAKTGTRLRYINAGFAFVDLHFSPTNTSKLMVVGVAVHQCDVDTGQLYQTSAEGKFFGKYSPDGRTIAAASDNNCARDVLLLNAESGKLRMRLVGHQREVNDCSWSPDGSTLASASNDSTCRVWDSSTGALLRTIQLPHQCRCLSWGRDWMQDMAMAFAMGQHPRLGSGSQVLDLEVGLVRMIVDLA
jgi:WD40 repeat protein